MSIQARMSQGDPRLYSPARDVAHNFGAIMTEVAQRCEEGKWSALNDLLKEKSVSDEEVGKVCQSLCRFVFAQTDLPGESMASCLSRCGFFELSATARVVVMAHLGTVTLGVHWAGVHEATIGGAGPAMSYKHLRWHGMICAKLMTMPRWRRRLYMLRRRLTKAWRALWAADRYEDQ